MKKLWTIIFTLFFILTLAACQNKNSDESLVLNQTNSNGFPQISGSFVVNNDELTIKKNYGNELKTNDTPESTTNLTDEQQDNINMDGKKNSFSTKDVEAGREYTSTFKKVEIKKTHSELLISSEDNTWKFEKIGDRIFTDQNGATYELSE